ncbi:hypothetical protein BGY98DRAFT_991972 [Russula aff. rugulosa BPL654]|nr:hypothetical protein BGY98DRAFT_991972 [Russula aff. rugulosa BPL654]
MRSKISTRVSRPARTSLAVKRSTPTPVKITFTGDITRPTPSPTIAEKVYRTFTVGSSHFVRRS